MPEVYSDRRLLEIACFQVDSCLIAQQAGADRIEFCVDYAAGGVTPTYADIRQVRQQLTIPLHVIIRPRGGDFVYTSQEVAQMKQDILFCKQQAVEGIVLGALTNDHQIDVQTVQELAALAGPMSLTFHRAIDGCKNLEEAVQELIEIGFRRILTSGGKPSAVEGMNMLHVLQHTFGKKIILMPGGGIRSHNLEMLARQTGCVEFHSAAITDASLQVDPKEIKQLKEIVSL